MKELREILVENLAMVRHVDRIDFLIGRINETVNPPKPATPEKVNIRAMYIVNDRINSHGGRFRRADLIRICGLLEDTPVLIGHNRSAAPLARNFHAELEQKDGALWVKSYFYWPRVPDGQNDALLDRIDSGVLKECSISFIYSYPECSRCGRDIRTCPHEIERHNGGDLSGTHFIYGDISQILETSLVYKGSIRGTHLSDRLSHDVRAGITLRVNGRQLDIPVNEKSGLSTRVSVVALHHSDGNKPEIVRIAPGISACLGHRRDIFYLLARSVS